MKRLTLVIINLLFRFENCDTVCVPVDAYSIRYCSEKKVVGRLFVNYITKIKI
jgi:hypothetical protein